ncbi:MAG: hypothetical protein NXI24_22170 [bacterium]|nr:hypothetical protein [bacterium]
MNDIEIHGSQLCVRDLSLERKLWAFVQKFPSVQVLAKKNRQHLRSSIRNAFQQLEAKAHTDWGPVNRTESHMSVLDCELRRWHAFLPLYEGSLKRCKGDIHRDFAHYQAVVAISRDYANLLLPLVQFYGSMCNLYPLLQWLTGYEQARLRMAFSGVPWDEIGEKEGHRGYEKALKQILRSPAIDSASSDKALRITLSNSLAEIKVSLYHLNRYGDLVIPNSASLKQLTKFMNQKPAFMPESYWRANAGVIKASIEFLSSMRKALNLIGSIL